MSTTHKPARAMLALIALAVDLPMPTAIYLYRTGEVGPEPTLAFVFDTVADGIAWAAHLNVTDVNPHVNAENGIRYLGHRSADTWHGWRLSLSASEPASTVTGPGGSDESAALTALAAAA